MTDTNGRIKVRVSRFDEDSGSAVLRFVGNNLAFWQTMGRHPLSSTAAQATLLTNVRGDCFGKDTIPLPGMSPNFYDIPNSFMINGDSDSHYNKTCRDNANALIQQGFVTEVCAEYYLEDHYKMRFIPCNKQSCP